MSDQDRDITDVFDQLREQWLGTVQTAIPGIVRAYNPLTQLADVQPLIMQITEDASGARVATPCSIVPGVPVVWQGSADGSYAQTFPLAVGDTGMLLASHASIDVWWGLGRDEPIDPQDERRHDLSDAVFLPGVRNKFRALAAPATDAWVIAAPQIRLGSATANGDVVVQQALTDFIMALGLAIPGAGAASAALTSLQTQLAQLNGATGWKARTTKTKAE